jgi:hypothetical protein
VQREAAKLLDLERDEVADEEDAAGFRQLG